MLFTAIQGMAHENGPIPIGLDASIDSFVKAWSQDTAFAGTVMPFTVGDVDPAKGFVHVFAPTPTPEPVAAEPDPD
jgi:hypothetical protein